MDVIYICLGLLLIILPAVDIFRELFQPRGHGLMSRTVARIAWRTLRAPARRSSSIALLVGPSIMLLILMMWLACSMLGWALLLTPAMDGGGAFAGHGADHGFVSALYMSLVTISTLGYGDLVPAADWSRMLMPLEAVFGLGVAAGTIGWLMNVQPVLSRRSALASKVVLLERAERATGSSVDRLHGATETIRELTSNLASVQSDLMHFPLSYYFFPGERLRSLPSQFASLLDVAARCAASQDELTRFHGAMLEAQLHGALRSVARTFLRIGDDAGYAEILAAWRRDHEVAWDV